MLVELELELDLHLGGTRVDQLVYRARPRAAPQSPGDRVQQSGFTVAIVAGQDGDVNAVEAERLMDVRIAHEVSDVERQRNHDLNA